VLYIFFSLIGYSILISDLPIKTLIKGAFIDQVIIHIGILSLIALIIGIIWDQKSRGKDQNDNEIP